MELTISRHAETRMAQRGFSCVDLDSLLSEAEVEYSVGRGAVLVCLARAQTGFGSESKLARYGAILAADGTVVTVLPLRSTRSSRRYRRRYN